VKFAPPSTAVVGLSDVTRGGAGSPVNGVPLTTLVTGDGKFPETALSAEDPASTRDGSANLQEERQWRS
jgi:hypothetical protein